MKPRFLKYLLCIAVFVTLALSCSAVTKLASQGTTTAADNNTVSSTVPTAVTIGDNRTDIDALSSLLRAEDYDGVIQEARAALDGTPDDLILREKLADAYIARAWYYKVKRLNPYTLNDLSKAVEVAPKYYRAYYELGRFHNNQWQFSIGLLDLNKALSLRPDFAPAYSERGYSNYKNQKYDAALADVNKAIELDPSVPYPYCVRSLVYVATGKPDLALEDADKAVRIAPEDAASYYNRSLIYTATDKPELAMADLETTLKLSQDDMLTTRARANLRAIQK